ncbi:MAG: hypothetical protein AAGF24_06845 [Cyanobacteria bacterium P01_H01_bin.121]
MLFLTKPQLEAVLTVPVKPAEGTRVTLLPPAKGATSGAIAIGWMTSALQTQYCRVEPDGTVEDLSPDQFLGFNCDRTRIVATV